MKHVRDFNDFRSNRYQKINEEFIGKLLGALKGELGKIFQQFGTPFKDLSNDVKKLGDSVDATSVKNVILTNLNQAIDGIQKAIPGLKQESDVNAIMENFIKQLTELASGMGVDFDNALGKDKSIGPKAVAQAIFLENKDARWPGIIGLLNGQLNFKYSKTNYETTLTNASKGKVDKAALDARIKAAIAFFEGMQKEFTNVINKELTEDEMNNIFKKAKEAAGEKTTEAPIAGKDYVVKDKVRYKTLEYDPKLEPDKQADGAIGEGEVRKIEGQTPNSTITIFNSKINKEIEKKEEDILGKIDDRGPNAQELAQELGEIKADEAKMKQVGDFVKAIKDPANKNKIDQVNKILTGK